MFSQLTRSRSTTFHGVGWTIGFSNPTMLGVHVLAVPVAMGCEVPSLISSDKKGMLGLTVPLGTLNNESMTRNQKVDRL